MKKKYSNRSLSFILISVLLLGMTLYIQPSYAAIPGVTINIPMKPILVDISKDFTDPNFKQAVWEWLGNSGTPGVFKKQDIENQLLVKNHKLDVSNKSIKSLAGLEYFEGLDLLCCSGNQLPSLPTLPSTLTILYCNHNRLTSLPALPSGLRELYCDNNQLNSLPTLPVNLEQLHCTYNQLRNLPTLPNNLKNFYCDNNQLLSLGSTLPSSISYLSCPQNQLNNLPSSSGTLTSIDCSYNYIVVLNPELQLLHNASYKTQIPQYRLKYTGSDIQLDQGENKQLSADAMKKQMSADFQIWGDVENIDLSKLTFSSSNNVVAKVDSTGLITGQGEGTCNIYALLEGIDSDFTKTEITVNVSDQVVSGSIPGEDLNPGSGSNTPGGGGSLPDPNQPPVTTGELKILMTIDSSTAFINGTGKGMDVPPTIINDRTMVPFRFIGEALGAEVEWLGESSTVVVKLDGQEVRLVIGQTGPGLDVPAQIVNSRTMVPLRYLSESLGADVQWFQETRSVEIIK